jgi:hypothetical protein
MLSFLHGMISLIQKVFPLSRGIRLHDGQTVLASWHVVQHTRHVGHAVRTQHSRLEFELLVGRFVFLCFDADGDSDLRRGLKYVSKHRRHRVHAIADEISNHDYDLVGLQELWVSSDFEHVRHRVAERLPYAKYFYR